MYLEHYGLTTRPFDLNPDPAFLYLSSQHEIAYSMLEYGLLSQRGITVITGEVGSGKTTLLRHLLNNHDADEIQVGLLADTDEETAEQLYQWISMSFNLDHTTDKITLKKNFQNFLVQNYSKGKTCVLIVDEAQNLSLKALEKLRLLNNINTGEDELLKIILMGQPELVEKLRNPHLKQFAQRITVEYHLYPLAVEETPKYISHRLNRAGSGREVFDKSAIYSVYFFSGGIPRLINMLCDYALLYGYAKGVRTLDTKVILEVVRGRRIGGVAFIDEISEDMEIAREFVLGESGLDLLDSLKRVESIS
ncbi:ExeA family protein [Haliea sp. E17]|uniref:ExeA family protein n=1 Tax=Haliea sp. E17 TaxID=3401576 RepID=UPI003AAC5298